MATAGSVAPSPAFSIWYGPPPLGNQAQARPVTWGIGAHNDGGTVQHSFPYRLHSSQHSRRIPPAIAETGRGSGVSETSGNVWIVASGCSRLRPRSLAPEGPPLYRRLGPRLAPALTLYPSDASGLSWGIQATTVHLSRPSHTWDRCLTARLTARCLIRM